MSQLEKDLLKKAFFDAVEKDDAQKAQAALDKGLSVNALNSGNTALAHAIRWHKPRMAAFLIAAGVDINSTGVEDMPPVVYASKLKEWEIAKLLLKNNADANACGAFGDTALFYAVDDLATLKMLLIKGAGVNAQNDQGQTPLMSILCEKINIEPAVKEMLKTKPDLSLQDKDGNTALHYAVIYQPWEVVEAIIDAGGDIRAENKKGLTVMELTPSAGSAALMRQRLHEKLLKVIAKEELDADLKDYSPGIKEAIDAPQRIQVRRKEMTP